MHLAAEKGKHLRLRSFLTRNIDALDRTKRTPLYLASYNGHLRCVTMLLDAKADVNALAVNDETSLMAATRYGHLEVVNALIEAHADVNICTASGSCALSCACDDRHDPNPYRYCIISALLDAGALVNTQNTSSLHSPLTIAIQFGSIETVKLLIERGADVNRDVVAMVPLIGGGNTVTKPISFATFYGSITAAKLLLDAKADVMSDIGFFSSLFTAVELGYVEFTKLYITAGADVNKRIHDDDDLTCLYKLVSSCVSNGKWSRKMIYNENFPYYCDKINTIPVDYPGVFQVLIDAKADVSARGPKGATPLISAASVNNVEAVNALLNAGANVNETYGLGETPLICASAAGHLDTVLALITANADLNCANINGINALACAVLKGNALVVSALIAAGIDVNHRVSEQKVTVLDIGPLNEDVRVILENAGVKTKEQLFEQTSDLVRATLYRNVKSVVMHVNSASIEEKNMALYIAIRDYMPDIVKCLLAAGADPGSLYSFERSCVLTCACVCGHEDIVRELINADADVAHANDFGVTPIKMAAMRRHRNILAMLLAKAKQQKKSDNK